MSVEEAKRPLYDWLCGDLVLERDWPDGYVKHIFYPGWYFASNPDPLAQQWAKNGSNCAICGLTEPACAALNHVRPNCATIKGYRQETADAR